MSELSDYLDSMQDKITLESKHIVLLEDKDWPRDQWLCTFKYYNNELAKDYYAGLGHRKKVRIFDYNYQPRATDIWKAKKGYLLLVNPKCVDVLHCLLSDAQNADDTFENWCGNLGYDTDSRKALDTYLECQKTRNDLIRFLGYGLFEKLLVLEH